MKKLLHIFVYSFAMATGTALAQGDNGRKTANDSIVDAYTTFIEQSRVHIKRNEHAIDSVKQNCESRLQAITAKYQQQIDAANPKDGKNIEALKQKRDKRIADVKASCDIREAQLEAKNEVIRQRLKEASPGGWKAMQAQMNSDMDSFEQFLLSHDKDAASDD